MASESTTPQAASASNGCTSGKPTSTKFLFSPHCIAVGMFEGPVPGTERRDLESRSLIFYLAAAEKLLEVHI
jgi:hypothetical protein